MSKKGEKIKHPLEYLRGDHREVSALIKKLEEISHDSEGDRKNIFKEINKALSLHMDLEENTIYPVLEEFSDTKEMVLEAKQEHHTVRTILKELENQDITTDNWIAKAQVLEENITHHIKEEEKPDGLLDKTESLLSEDDLEMLRKNMEKYLN